MASGKLIREILDAGVVSTALSFSPDGKRLVSVGSAGAIGLWDVATGKEAVPLVGHRHVVTSLAFSPDGGLLASQGGDQTVRLWSIPAGKVLHQFPLEPQGGYSYLGNFKFSSTSGLAFSPEGSLLTATGPPGVFDRKVRMWDVDKGQLLEEWSEPRFPAEGVAFTPDGKALCIASRAGVRVRSLPKGEELRLLTDGVSRGSSSLAVPSPGRLLALGDEGENRVLLWDYQANRRLREIQTPRFGAKFLAFSPDARLLMTGGHSTGGPGTMDLSLWEAITGSLVRTLGKQQCLFINYAFSPDSRLLATADALTRKVRVWSVWTGKELACFEGHAAPARCVAFSPEGRLLASGSVDTTILLWDVSKLDGRPPATSPSSEQLDTLWAQLGGDAAGAFKAIATLSGAGSPAVVYLSNKLKPAPKMDPKGVQALLANLNADDFKVRDAAARELAALGERVEPLLKQALAKGGPLDYRASVQRLLDGISPLPTGEQVRESRALWVLELVGTAAREELRRLAGGDPAACLTREARAALQRLERLASARRPAPTPKK
jgi:WD40 repeat protein